MSPRTVAFVLAVTVAAFIASAVAVLSVVLA